MATEIIIAVISANALFGFLQFLIIRGDQRKKSPERDILLGLAGYRLKVLLIKWKNGSARQATNWELIDNLYNGYKELGGNGEIKKLYDECGRIESIDGKVKNEK